MGMTDRIVDMCRVDEPRHFRLKDIDPADTGPIRSKEDSVVFLRERVERLADMQEKLYADHRWSLLLIVQAMDAAGKDSAIKHVMSGVNPQGCEVYSFKAPTTHELDHDYLWRTTRCLPERGRIGIFNRSYYEETLIVRVHPELLAAQRIPASLLGKDIWKERFEDIRAHERYLGRNGVKIVKCFLHISREEQRRRFLARIDEPAKRWKFAMDDVSERRHWHAYMQAYQEMIRETSTRHTPWHVIPADSKWFAHAAVAAIAVDALSSLDLKFPTVGKAKLRELERARKSLAKD
jgi:PPK2 family polyphosphate:nucleotide phosphotransferase